MQLNPDLPFIGRIMSGSVLAIAGLTNSVWAQAATQCINQNAPVPLEICVQDSGTPAVYVQQPNGRTAQYYNDYAWGSLIWLNGASAADAHSTGYWDIPGSGWEVPTTGETLDSQQAIPVSNTLTGSGSVVDPYVITTVLELGTSGVRLTQRFSYVDGDRTLKKSWSLSNDGGSSFSDVRFFHGGDTTFGGDDSARSWYDPANTMIYVNNSDFINTGFMGFYANPATPASHYYGGYYDGGNNSAGAGGPLPNTADSSFVDAGYYLQWSRASLEPGQSWNIEAFEVWSAPGATQVISPSNDFVSPATTVQRLFKVHNLSTDAVQVDLVVQSTEVDWSATLAGPATISLAGLERRDVLVDVVVPASSLPGDSADITLSADAGLVNPGSGLTRLSVLDVDFSIAPETWDFGTLAVGDEASRLITFSNQIDGSAVTLGNIASANPLSAPFSILEDNCSNLTLAAGESCSVTVRYAPTAAGAASDTFSWPLQAPVITSRTISLSGNAVVVAAGVCGPAEGVPSLLPPASADLCSTGTPTGLLAESGSYSWSCQGVGGAATTQCAAPGTQIEEKRVTASLEGPGCVVESAQMQAPPLGGPSGVNMPFGVLNFAMTDCSDSSVTVNLTFSGSVDGMQYWKFINDNWLSMPATLSGNTASFEILDNGEFDADPAMGRIVDPSGPGIVLSSGPDLKAIPSLTPWSILLLVSLLSFFSAGLLRRQKG